MRGAAITAAMVAIGWFAWSWSAHLAGWAGFDELDFLIQLAGLLVALTLADRLLSRLLPKT